MKLLLIVCFTGTFAVLNAQTANQPSTPLTEDSIQRIFTTIDSLSYFELKKVRESYIYKNRTEPCEENRRILLYVEEKMKTAK